MRRYEREGVFWEVRVDGCCLITRFGVVGQKPREAVRELADPTRAGSAMDRAVAARLGEGFVEVEAATEGGRRLVGDSALEERLHDHPDDLEGWQVYADMLLQHGTASELARLVALEVESAASGERPGMATERAGLSSRIFEEPPNETSIRTRFGFFERVRGVALPGPPDALRFLREIDVEVLEDGTGPAALFEALRETPPRGLRRVTMSVHWPEDIELSWVDVGRFGLFELCPRLESVHLIGGGIELGPVRAPRLKQLVLETAGLSAEPLVELARGALPRLEDLEIWTGEAFRVPVGVPVAEASHVDALIRHDLPNLRRLAVRNCRFADAVVASLLDTDLPARLTHLDLSLGALTDAGANALIAAGPRVAHLSLDVQANVLSEDAAWALQHAFPTARVDGQRAWEGMDEYLYVAVTE
ncbi:MAG: WGR domain-containing protein [Alphaproteobacteria bacterium]|nr:WGR domain-containing protein [Alphaproteobacteria bacterium]